MTIAPFLKGAFDDAQRGGAIADHKITGNPDEADAYGFYGLLATLVCRDLIRGGVH